MDAESTVCGSLFRFGWLSASLAPRIHPDSTIMKWLLPIFADPQRQHRRPGLDRHPQCAVLRVEWERLHHHRADAGRHNGALAAVGPRETPAEASHPVDARLD